MDYSFLGVTVTAQPSGGFGSFFRPITRMFPNFFPVQPRFTYRDEGLPACLPVPIPAGTLGRDANGNLTVNGQTHCYTAPGAAYNATYRPVPYGAVY